MSFSSMHSMRDDSPSSDDTPTRKRVGKACDRCRLKKSKCDGSNPCSRCTLDDQICTFTERKRSKEKTYPKGYVELLETRVDMLTEGLQELARRAASMDHSGVGIAMPMNGQRPSINKLLEDLGALQTESSNLNISLFTGEGDMMSASPQSSLHSPNMKYEAPTPPESNYTTEVTMGEKGFPTKSFIGLNPDQILFDGLEDTPASFAQAWNPTALEDLHSYQANMAFLNGTGFVSPYREEIDWTLA